MSLRASILIAAHNEGPCLRKTLLSVLDATYSLNAEIIIADDASTDDVPDDLAHEFPGVRLVRHPEHRGASPTRHLAATEARGEVLVFLDGHTHPEPGALRRLVEDVEQTAGDAIITPVVPHLDVESWTNSRTQVGHGYALTLHDLGCRWISQSLLKERRVGSRTYYESPALIGCAFAISRRLYNQLWGFDPHMRSWGVEDLDFGLKAWLLGFSILHDPAAIVGHRFRKSFDNFDVPLEHLWANQLRMARKHFTEAAWHQWVTRFREQHDRLPASSSNALTSQPSTLNPPEGPWARAWQTFLADRDSVEQERAYLLSRRIHDEFWYADRFGLDWPRLAGQRGSNPCGCQEPQDTVVEPKKKTAAETKHLSAPLFAMQMQASPEPSPVPSPSPSPCPCEIAEVTGETVTFRHEQQIYSVSGECLEDAEVQWSVSGGVASVAEDGLSVTVLWLDPGMNNSVSASCGETSASITVRTYAVDIVRDQGGATTRITGDTTDVIVGQKVTLQAQVSPVPEGGTSVEYQWSIPPKTLKDYVITFNQIAPQPPGIYPTADTSAVQIPLAAQDITSAAISFHCIDTISGTVQLTVSVSGRSQTFDTNLNVRKPTSSFTAVMTSQNPTVQIFSSGSTLNLGPGRMSPAEQQGVRFQASVTPPIGGDGEIALIQLVNSSRKRQERQGSQSRSCVLRGYPRSRFTREVCI